MSPLTGLGYRGLPGVDRPGYMMSPQDVTRRLHAGLYDVALDGARKRRHYPALTRRAMGRVAMSGDLAPNGVQRNGGGNRADGGEPNAVPAVIAAQGWKMGPEPLRLA